MCHPYTTRVLSLTISQKMPGDLRITLHLLNNRTGERTKATQYKKPLLKAKVTPKGITFLKISEICSFTTKKAPH